MKEYYKIGEISNLYGIGTDSLRYYEEIGILKPKRDDNGYRMYSISDIRTLNILRELRSIGFSMKEIKNHLTDFNLSKTVDLFSREIRTIDEKMAQLQSLRAQLTERIEEIRIHIESGSASSNAMIQKLPPRKILKLSENVYRDEDLDFIIKKLQKKHESHLYLIGNGDIGATIPLESIRQNHYGLFNSVFCVTDGEEDFDDTLSEGTYLTADIKGSYRQMPEVWKALFAELRHLGFDADGDPMELYIIDNHDTSNEAEFLTRLQIKIKEKH